MNIISDHLCSVLGFWNGLDFALDPLEGLNASPSIVKVRLHPFSSQCVFRCENISGDPWAGENPQEADEGDKVEELGEAPAQPLFDQDLAEFLP